MLPLMNRGYICRRAGGWDTCTILLGSEGGLHGMRPSSFFNLGLHYFGGHSAGRKPGQGRIEKKKKEVWVLVELVEHGDDIPSCLVCWPLVFCDVL